MKPFPDQNNTFRWFIQHDCTPEEEVVTTYYKSEQDFELGMERYGKSMISYGVYNVND